MKGMWGMHAVTIMMARESGSYVYERQNDRLRARELPEEL